MVEELLSQQEFKRVCQLAGLEPPARAAGHTAQLGALLRHFSSVQEVSAAAQASGNAPAAKLRKDVVAESLSRDELLRMAPETEDGFIKVRTVA